MSLRRLGLILLVVGAAAVAWLGWSFGANWTGDGPLRAPMTVSVPEGASIRSMASRLQQAGAIRSAESFRLGARLFGSGAPIKAGNYRLPKQASAAEILAILQSGKTVQLLVAIPEGLPSILVYERLMAKTDLTGPLAVPAEGSVLPDSYAYEKGESRAAVLKRMQAAMTRLLDRTWPGRDPDILVKTRHEALTLASIVEKETAVPAERSTVAGVYYNRLKVGMRLQADPTIIYPITKGKPLGRRIRQSELRAVNGYNTYAMVGLPKGPIANPGRAAIDAVLHPAQTHAVYFVADGKGGHVFADTYAEHQANVRKWFAIRRARGEL
ncbi:MAG TPA: endolytic transglycosylase MltG [Sphingomonas sp.]|nr:endolytic transglycosylase MltG [Sphingomonas sp.]